MLNYENIKQYLPTDLSENIINQINSLEFFPVKPRYNITGQKFNQLIVLGKGPNIQTGKRSFGQWWCLCDCGNIILARHNNIVSGNTKSCGCLNTIKRKENIQKAINKTKLDLTKQKFGSLLALHPTSQRKNNSIVWECLCDCGNTHFVSASELQSHRIESCGCKKFQSKGCQKIKQILDQNNISYVCEKTFPDCRFPKTKGIPRYDFFINQEFLLEFDGIQHFEERDSFFKDTLSQRQENDLYKNNWAKEHNIPLKRIPYTEIDNITLEAIIGNQFLIL